mgnify:CR=1 FL=1
MLFALHTPEARAIVARALFALIFFASPAAWAGVDWVVNNSDTGYDPVAAGGNVVYVVRVGNNGNDPAPATTLTLNIPSTASFVSASGMSCSGTGPVSCTVPALGAAGNSDDSATVNVTIRTTVAGNVMLGASVPTAGDDDAGNNTANESTTVNTGADIALALSGPASAQAGSTVSYTFTATNHGPDASGAQTLSFPVPTGLINISAPGGCTLSGSTYNCTLAALANGASTTRAFSGQIAAAGGSTLTPSGSVTTAVAPLDPITSNNNATFNTTVTAGSDLRIAKSRAPGGTLLVGQAVTFTLTPSYTGDSPNSLTITDTLPANYTVGTVASPQNGWSCSVSGQTVTCSKAAGSGVGANVALGAITIPATVASAGSNVTNSASIASASPIDPNPSNNTASDAPATIQAATVDLRANKSGPNPALAVVGVPFTWSISASNIGSAPFYGTVQMVDTLPAGVTVNSYNLNGWSCSPAAPVAGPASITCTRVYTSGAPLAAGATTPVVALQATSSSAAALTNSLTVSSPDANIADTNPGNDTVTHGVTASVSNDAADLRVVKTASPNPVAAGDVLTYTLEIVNAGPNAAGSVTLTDTLSSLINNSVGATGAGLVSFSIVGGSSSGGSCSSSAGNATTRNLSCSFTSIPVCGQGNDCPVVTVQVRPGGNGGNRTNTASAVSSVTADPNTGNNSGSATSTVTPRADVTVTKTATPASVPAGQDVTYVVAATNLANGLSTASAVTITDTLPHDVTFISATPSAGTCATQPAANSTTTGGNDQVVCNLGAINNGGQQTVTIVARPNTATRGSALTNTVSVSTTTTETDGTNNSASATTNVSNPVLDLLVNKTDSVDPVASGDDTVYTVMVTNQGPSAAENLVVTDILPTRLAYRSHTVPAGGACSSVPAVDSTGGTLVCGVSYLPAGQSRSFTVTMRGAVKGVDTNAVSVTSDEAAFESNTGNNSASQQTTVRTKADMQVVSKTPSSGTVNLRDNFTFTVKVRNNAGAGLAEADGVVVSDTLPTGMELTGTPTATVIAGSATSTTCTGSAGGTSFTCNLGTVSSGGEIDIVVPVQLIAVTAYPQTFTNTATVATSSLDTVPGNNSASGGVTVNSSSIAGRVFRDFNDNGAVDAGDTGIAGITVMLTGTSFDGAAVSRSVTTDASGNYVFTNLPQSDGTGYTVREGAVSEAHLNDGADTAGSAGGNSTAVNDQVSGVVLGANTQATGYLFAEVPQARVGIAKQVVGSTTTNADGSFNVVFRLVVRNHSLEALSAVNVTDALAGAAPRFGTYNAGTLADGQYKMAAAPSGSCGGLQAGFTGSGAGQTVAVIPSLTAGMSCSIDFALQVRPTAPLPPLLASGGRYENQAVVEAAGALSGQTPATNPQLRDLSDNGANPDANGNGRSNEAGENDPTPVAPGYAAAIGIAKQLNGGVAAQGDGSLVVPIRLVVANVGDEPLHGVSITDPLSAAAGGPFGGFVAGGATAALASGQYTVQTAPAFSGACANGAAAPGYTGDSGNVAVATISAMPTSAFCTIDFAFRFMPAVATAYVNQAQASGTGDYTNAPVVDLSDHGTVPDPNGNGNAGEAGENDPTPIPVPRIGLAKSAGAVVNHGDGTYSVSFTLRVANAGGTALSGVQINDTLAGALPQFGVYTANAVPAAGEYTVTGGPTVSAQSNGASLTAVAAGAYTGSGAGTGLLVPASSSLPNFGGAPSSAQVAFTVRFFPTAAGPFNNSATAAGSPPGGGTVTDASVDGAVPDANGNGDPGDDASPTPVSLAAQAIGVAKRVTGVVQLGAKRFRVPYSLVVQNVGTSVTATHVQVRDDLAATFPTATSRTVAAAPTVSGCTGTVLNPNPAFDGSGANALLVGNQNLQPGEACTISFAVDVDFGANPLPAAAQNNQAQATTYQTPGGTVIATDLSDDGVVPDPNGNGNAGEAGENDPTPVSFAQAALSAVNGTVYLDANHNRVDDDAPAPASVQGFIVEALNSAGAVVGSAVTDAGGRYAVGGLFPSTPGNPATEYSLRFRDPVNGAIYGTPQSNDPTPARNGSVSNGVIAGLSLAAGTTTIAQNLPLDPSGVVYDAITRTPVSGAQLTLEFGGAPVPGSCLVAGTNTQTTGPSGQYQFLLLNPAPPGCPGSGAYTLRVVQPGGYLPPDSALIPPAAGVYTPGTGGVDAIQPQPGAPTGAASTLYYTSFALTLTGTPGTSSSSVVNNHIPLDPVLGGAIALTKSTPLVNVSVGQLVPYTITARNTLAVTLGNIDIRDTLPPGFKYKPGSATVDGVKAEPTINGREIAWIGLTLAGNASRVVKLLLVVGAGVQPGEYVNTAQALNGLVGAAVSAPATATVRVIPDPLFDCSDLIGKVFDDRNANGYQDDGEPGIPNVRLATARGWLVTTDAEGRFHVACAAIPDAERGSNFIMKLDERTLPSGYRVTTENPRDVRLTRGKLSKLNFGATIHKVVRVDMSDAAFEAGQTTLKAAWTKQLAALPGTLKARPTVLRLGYTVGADGEARARERLRAVGRQVQDDWKRTRCCHTLLIEEELFLPAAAGSPGGPPAGAARKGGR